MTRFEDNLWRELEDTYGGELSQAEGPLPARPALRRPAIAGAGLGVVGAGAAAVLILTAAGSTPAFAVTPQRDGSVSVVIRRIDGIPGANRRLAELGIRARAVRVADGCQAVSPGALTQVAVATLVRRGGTAWVGRTPDTIRTQIRPAQIPSGRTLVIPALRTGARVRLVRGHAVRGAVPACLSPAVQVRTAVAGPIIQVVGCRDGSRRRPRPVRRRPGAPSPRRAPAPWGARARARRRRPRRPRGRPRPRKPSQPPAGAQRHRPRRSPSRARPRIPGPPSPVRRPACMPCLALPASSSRRPWCGPAGTRRRPPRGDRPDVGHLSRARRYSGGPRPTAGGTR